MGKYALELKHGEEAEETFAELAELNGYYIEESTNYSNIVEHIDFYLASKRGLDDFSVDVKARKKSRRNNTWYDDQMVWVEFHNVAGKKGWLYGEADKIAFERKNDFVIVDGSIEKIGKEKQLDLVTSLHSSFLFLVIKKLNFLQ